MRKAKTIEEFDKARQQWAAELRRRLAEVSPEPEPDYPAIIRDTCEFAAVPAEYLADVLGVNLRTLEGWAQGRRPSEEWRAKLIYLERFQSGK